MLMIHVIGGVLMAAGAACFLTTHFALWAGGLLDLSEPFARTDVQAKPVLRRLK